MVAQSPIFSALHTEAHHLPEKSQNQIDWKGPRRSLQKHSLGRMWQIHSVFQDDSTLLLGRGGAWFYLNSWTVWRLKILGRRSLSYKYFSLYLHEQGRGYWGGKKWMDVWRQIDTWSKLHCAMESWDTRMKGWHHMDRPGPGLLVSSIAEVIHVGEKRQRPTDYRRRWHILHAW